MTIILSPDQERAIQDAIQAGRFRSVKEFIDAAIAGLAPRESVDALAERQEAIRRMQEFGERHRLSLGEPVTRKLLHEGHRY